MLGLPDGVTACLFDLDGVLTDTASVHDAAWKEMFDAFLRGAGRAGRLVRAVRPGRGLRAVRRRQAAAGRRPRLPGQPRHHAARGRTRTTRPDAETVNGLGNRKNADGPAADPDRRRARCTRARGATCEAARDAGLRRRGGVVERQHRARCWRSPGWRRLRRAPGRRRDDPRPSTSRASRRRTRSSRRADRLGVAPAQCAVFEDALAGVAGRSRRRTSATWSASTGSAQADALRAHGADVVVSDLAELLTTGRPDDRPATVPGRAVARDARPALDLDLLAQSESLFALSNGHIGLRGNLDEGEPYGIPGTYLNSLLRAAAAAVRRGRLRLPGVGPDRSSTSPTAS